jgi:hypothetical protein
MSCCELCETEVENLEAIVTADEEVVGLEIAVDDVFVVGDCQALCNLRGIVDRVALRQRIAIEHEAEWLAFE